MAKTPQKKPAPEAGSIYPATVQLTAEQCKRFDELERKKNAVMVDTRVAIAHIERDRAQHADTVALAHEIDTVDSYEWDADGKGTRKQPKPKD